jgi:hypothetical protein
MVTVQRIFKTKGSGVGSEYLKAAEVHEIFSGNQPCLLIKLTEISGTISISIIMIKI